jgi:hypothetical protein
LAERAEQWKIFEDRQSNNQKFQQDFQARVLGQAHNIDGLTKRTHEIDDLLKWKSAYTEIQRESKKEM